MKRKIVKNKQEYLDWVNAYNGRMNCYTTVYDFEVFGENTKIDNSVVLDRMFLDFDAHDEPLVNAYYDFVGVCTKYLEENIKFRPYFSGQGFHIIVYGEVADDIRSIQRYYSKLATDYDTLDRTGIQTNRLRRVPNTENMKVGRFCIPVNIESEPSLDDILSLTDGIVADDFVYGSNLVRWPEVEPISMSSVEIDVPDSIGRLPILPCLHNAITVENPSHYARVYLTQWYRDLLSIGQREISLEAQNQIIAKIMEEFREIANVDGIWLDWDESKTRGHVEYIVSRGYNAPGCRSVLIPQGYCIGKCWRYNDED
tara:strand:+ start:2617 stop:3555 length:939 start_codon:yes stop_codon:yes gene_type:complete